MPLKRKQYFINYYKFSNLITNNNQLEFSKEDVIVYQNSENILYETVQRLKNHTYDNSSKNEISEIFILNAKDISTKNESQIDLYKRIMSDGVLIDGEKFKRFGKSSSMAMNQRTLFVREDLHDKLKEYISLSKQPETTTISKYETAIGLSLSSCNLIQGLPKIAIIPDYNTTVVDDVKIVRPFRPSNSDPGYIEHLKQIEYENYYNEKIKQLEESFNGFGQLPLSISEEHKSKAAWKKNFRRVKLDELDKPQGYKVLRRKNKQFLVYSYDQTEEIPNKLNKYSLGYDLVTETDFKNQTVPFDGQGLISYEYSNWLSKKLNLNYMSNGYQIRLPYIKGLVITIDFKSWFAEKEITHITDLWGKQVDVRDVDIILTESCFKAKLEATQGKNKWLFSSSDEYITLLQKYGHNYIGITNYIKSHEETDIYTDLNYQFINSLNLTVEDLVELAKKPIKLYLDILRYGDTASVKAFLNMIIKEGTDEVRLDTDVALAIDLDSRMIFDPRIQKFIRKQIQQAIQRLLIGRIPIKGDYKYITGDCIAFLQHAGGLDVNGLLGKDEYFCSSKLGEYVLLRNPLTSWHEVKKGEFVELSNAKYIQHLNNVIQVNINDLTMSQLSGADFDGDKILLTNDSKIVNGVITDLVIITEDNTPGKTKLYNIESIIEFELRNLSNLTAKLTNINTFIQSKALESGDLKNYELAIASCKQLQGELIDSIKKGTNPIIPDVLLELQSFKPYFQRYIYEDFDKTYKGQKYQKINTPLNQFVYKVEKLLDKLKKQRIFDSIGYIDRDTYNLIIDESRYDRDLFFNLCEKVIPIYNEYAKRSGEIYREQKSIKKVRASDEDKENLKLIKQKYKELAEDTRNILSEICDNPSILTSVCAYIEYHESKSGNVKDKTVVRTESYLFPWICTQNAYGLLENIRTNCDNKQLQVMEIKELNRKNMEYTGILFVKDGIATIGDQVFKTKLKNGKYRCNNYMGYHYIDFDIEREIATTSENITMKTEITEIKDLKNYKVRLHTGIRSGEEVSKLINNKTLKLNKSSDYFKLLIDEEEICFIYNEYAKDLKQRIYLEDYINHNFYVHVEKVNNKSLTVTLDLVV
ncbi:MAG: hypothetical protein K0S34_109 [Bacillales bacterium]|jgi:hypothetical protein|nr:hypothetical protein [Bacillales bacterium]